MSLLHTPWKRILSGYHDLLQYLDYNVMGEWH